MSDTNEKQAFWVDEMGAEDFAYDGIDQFVVEEDYVDDYEMFADEQIVVEEEYADDDQLVVEEPDYIPGSEAIWEEPVDNAEDQKPKDWENDKDHSQFVVYVKNKLNKIPKHSGETVVGCERAKAFLKSLGTEISQAMRTDLNGAISEEEIDSMRKLIDNMIEKLDKQIKKLEGGKRADLNIRLIADGSCKKCNSTTPMWHDVEGDRLVCMSCDAEVLREHDQIEKTANTPVMNTYVSAFERAIVGTIVNSTVSAGRNINETFEHLKDKYNFTPREELAITQLLSDYGYPTIKDRGRINEPHHPSSGDSIDFQTNYYA